jgi:hypothetical protein
MNSDLSDNISLDLSRNGTPDSLKQLHTMAEGRAFPEMQPMMKRFLHGTDDSVDMPVRIKQTPSGCSRFHTSII